MPQSQSESRSWSTRHAFMCNVRAKETRLFGEHFFPAAEFLLFRLRTSHSAGLIPLYAVESSRRPDTIRQLELRSTGSYDIGNAVLTILNIP